MREPFYLAPEVAAARHLHLIPTPEPEPVEPRPDPIVRRSLPGSLWELGVYAVGAVWAHVRRR